MTLFLETQNLTLDIAQKTVCQALSLQIKSGDIWAVLGPNGSGKTTFLQSLAGLHAATSGDIFLMTHNLKTYARKKIAENIGILFQETQFIFPQTVFEFCYSGRHPHKTDTLEDHRIVMHVLQEMELDEFAQRKTFNLSGGEKQRLAIATVLAQMPMVYLLDEPTNHLDLRHQIRTLQCFKKIALARQASIVMTTHDLNVVQKFCNRVLMIFADGETLQGNVCDVLMSENVSRLYGCSIKESNSAWTACL